MAERQRISDKKSCGLIQFATNVAVIRLHNSDDALPATGNSLYDPVSAGVFGKGFDCRSVDDSLHCCGMARFDQDGALISFVLMQSAVGVSSKWSPH